ncbi:MAG: hypothetical protein KDI82_00645 [Gammaproteobacteria bacterium]|nr:hypothetical protein [Gammaproteobacteria bacterium]
MTTIRTPELGMLADLVSVGHGLLIRYNKLAEDSGEPLATQLQHIITRRMPLLQQLTAAEHARGDLPDTADREINEIRSTLDSITGSLLGENSARQRLQSAEREWMERLHAAQELDWDDDETQLLQALLTDSLSAIDTLSP